MFVEGTDDQAFASHQIELVHGGDEWHVHFLEGKDYSKLLHKIDVVMVDSWFSNYGKSISVVQDADLDASGTFNRIASVFRKLKLPVPTNHGSVARDARWATGIFVMPDGIQNGSLENLLLQSIPDASRMERANKYVSDATTSFGPLPYPAKSTLQSYLAVQDTFLKWISMAIKFDHVLPASGPATEPFRQFILDLGN